MVEIEAESLGKGLISTDLGFSVEAIEEGVNGYKVKVGDIEGFVDRIKGLWGKPEKCREVGHNARKDYEMKYMPEDNYGQLMSIYEQTIA